MKKIPDKKTFFGKIYLSLRRIFGITSSTATDWVRSGPALFFTFIYPIVMILLFGYIFGAAPDDSLYTLHYYNEDIYVVGDQSYSFNPASQLLLELGSQNETIAKELNLHIVEVNLTGSSISYAEWMKNNDIPYLMVIPSGWSEAVNESKVNTTAPIANINYYYDPSYTSSFEVRSIIDNVLQEMNLNEFGISTTILIEVEPTPSREGLDYIDFYVPGMIMVTISTSGMMGMVGIITEQRQSGLLYKISSSPIKKWEWALGQQLWQVIMGIMVSILTILTGWIAFDFNLTTLHPLMILVIIFGTMTFAGLALILGRFIKRPEAAMAATMSIVFPQMFLSGAIFPAEILPNYMQIIAKIFPLYYVSEAMRNMMLESTFHKAWIPFGVTIAMGLVFFILGSIITNWRKE
ncbi:MAG TPA: ABC transporter permease [candidate division Zixibacteria bacterium]|nr:ABC transporter permease [candidate division Zixibacteria bacterium]